MSKPFKIFQTTDCIKLTNFEKVLLSIIKGEIYDSYHAGEGHYLLKDHDFTANITISEVPCTMAEGSFCQFKVENVAGALEYEIKKKVAPLSGLLFDGEVSVNFDPESKITIILFQRAYVPAKK